MYAYCGFPKGNSHLLKRYSLPENQRVCQHFFSEPISRSTDYCFHGDCASRRLHNSEKQPRQAPKYSRNSSFLRLVRPSIRVGWTNLPSSRTKRKEQSDFEISCRGFNLHQAQEDSLLSLPYLVMNPGFRVSKTENDVTEEMVYVGDIRGGFSCFRFRC